MNELVDIELINEAEEALSVARVSRKEMGDDADEVVATCLRDLQQIFGKLWSSVMDCSILHQDVLAGLEQAVCQQAKYKDLDERKIIEAIERGLTLLGQSVVSDSDMRLLQDAMLDAGWSPLRPIIEAEDEMLDKQAALWELCQKFIKENTISCGETIYQCDWVGEHSLELIEDICEIVGYDENEEDSE